MRVIFSIVALFALSTFVVVNSQVQIPQEQRPKSNFRFPSRLKIINQYDENTNANSNQQQGHFVQHLPNQNQPYGPPVHGNIRDCLCPCTKEYLPVCGSDLKTYGNNCLFQCQRKCNPALRFRSCGTCEEPNEEGVLPCQ